MKTKTFDFYCDPGHGWVKVNRDFLVKLGIQDKISSYSYQRKDVVYLEEDCDAYVFSMACKVHGITPKWREHHTNKQSKIRSYDRFCA